MTHRFKGRKNIFHDLLLSRPLLEKQGPGRGQN